MTIKVVKANGELVPFSSRAIERSVMKAGAERKYAREIAKRVRETARDGMKTSEVLDLALSMMKEQPEVRARYDLKRAIMSLGPHGFAFEEYFAAILRAYGYEAKTNVHMKGKAISQEVDILATKNNKTSMIEAKYHNKPGIYTDTKVAMYTYARCLDIKSNKRNKVEDSWLVTNTKATFSAIRYSKGVGQKVIAWNYPRKGNLRELIEKKRLYPITIFTCISDKLKEKLFRAGIVVAKDLEAETAESLMKKTGLSKDAVNKVLGEGKGICFNA